MEYRDVLRFPCLAAVHRAVHEQTVSRRIVPPIIECPELIERHITKDGVSQIVVRDGNIAGNAIIRWLRAGRDLPIFPRIHGVCDVSIVLERDCHLIWIARIDRHRWLGKKSRYRSQSFNKTRGRHRHIVAAGGERQGYWKKSCQNDPTFRSE